MSCTNYTSIRDAETALSNSPYPNWSFSLDADENAQPMTDEEFVEISHLMNQYNYCPGHAVKLWLTYRGEDPSDYEGLPDGSECKEENE